MKKVVLSVIAVLGIASAAWALTPNTNPDLEHSHAVENNAHEGHHHEIARQGCLKYQCTRCGRMFNGVDDGWGSYVRPGTRQDCPSTASKEHILQCID